MNWPKFHQPKMMMNHTETTKSRLESTFLSHESIKRIKLTSISHAMSRLGKTKGILRMALKEISF